MACTSFSRTTTRMNYLVLGAGMMGTAAAYDIATRNPSD